MMVWLTTAPLWTPGVIQAATPTQNKGGTLWGIHWASRRRVVWIAYEKLAKELVTGLESVVALDVSGVPEREVSFC